MFRSEQNVSKRQRSPSLDRATGRSAVKKQCKDTYLHHWIPSERFWDTLPRIHLTRRALAEHNRRNRQKDLKLHACEETAPRQRRSARLCKFADEERLRLPHCAGDRGPEPELQRFARGGGPDLTSIRGCPDPAMSNRTIQPSTRLTSSGTKSSKRSSPYEANYEEKLAQAGIFLTAEMDENNYRVKPANYDEILARLNKRRPSLSPSRFTEQDFERFHQQTEQAGSESKTMQQLIPIIEGDRGRILSEVDVHFKNLESFDPTIATAAPDSYDGAPWRSIDHRVLHDLNKLIVPTSDPSQPVAPNFFLEAKSSKGRADVAKRQAAHMGAIGARGMMNLQSYPTRVTQYDRNAYSFTNTYQNGGLKMYITHAMAPKIPGDPPQYHMTQLHGFDVTGSSQTFREGATYYRNARDLAEEQRNSFIQQANQAARQMPAGKRSESSRTTTNIASSVNTDNQSRERTHRYSPDTDTSADELALEDSVKRSRTGRSFDDGDLVPPRHHTNTGHDRSASTHNNRERRPKKTL